MNGPKVNQTLALVKPDHMRETPRTADLYSSAFAGSKNQTDMGTIRREGPECTGNPQRLYVRDLPAKLDAGWVTGFVDGEGCFHVGINKHAEMRCGYQVLPEFTVVQHERDVELLRRIRDFFCCGVVRTNHGDRWAYRVRGLKDLASHIVPFFVTHPLKSEKRVEFTDFCSVLRMMEAGDHLTVEGVSRIRGIAARMNRGRSR
jgi:LAGLIDADG DNA endonuclease family protein